MDIRHFSQKLIDEAIGAGFTDAEVYFSGSKDFQIQIRNKQISQYKNSNDCGFCFRGTYNGKMGYAFSEWADDGSIPVIIEEAKQNAEIMEEEEQDTLFEGSPAYGQVVGVDDSLNVTAEEKIHSALAMEAAAMGYSDKINAVDYCVYLDGAGQVMIKNSKGLDLEYSSNVAMAYCMPRATDGTVQKNAFAYYTGNHWQDYKPEELGRLSAKRAIAMLGAKSLPSKKYKVVFQNEIASDFISVFVSIFYADTVQKGFSMLKGKLGEKVASPIVTLRDDGLLEGGLATAPFDGEGVATSNKAVVENGVLKTFLHSNKTAAKDGIASTGNGMKASYKASVAVAASNFYMSAGDMTYDELLEKMNNGLLVTELDGLHSGANAVSGDFSLSATGFFVEDGKISHAVEQITIAGNFYELLNKITAVANDMRFGFPSGASAIGSPSFMVENVDVSGI